MNRRSRSLPNMLTCNERLRGVITYTIGCGIGIHLHHFRKRCKSQARFILMHSTWIKVLHNCSVTTF